MKKNVMIAIFALFAISCSKNDAAPKLTLSASKQELKYNETLQLSANIGSPNEYSWISSDKFTGDVDASGLFTAAHIGETEITAIKEGLSAKYKITVTPNETFFVEPIADFTLNKSGIKAKETRTIAAESESGLLYNNTGLHISQIMYGFENGLLSVVLADFDDTETAVNRAAAFYRERYKYLGYESDIIMFESKDKKVFVGLSVEDSWGFGALYIKNTLTNLSTANKIQIIVNQFEVQNKKLLNQ